MTDKQDGVNIWLAYSDLFAGMLIVFAAFYGLQNIQLSKERAKNENLLKAQNKAVELLNNVANRINERYKDRDKQVKTDGTQLVLPADVTFNSSQFSIRPESQTWLLEIASELEKAVQGDSRNFTIEIRGHTDAYQLNGGSGLPSNWELSSRRATELARLFQNNKLLDPTKFQIVAVGVGEFEEYEKNFKNDGSLKDPKELEELRKIQIRLIPNYGALLESVKAQSSNKINP